MNRAEILQFLTTIRRLKNASKFSLTPPTTVSKDKFGTRIGRLDEDDVMRLNRAIMVFLGLA